MSDQPEPVPMDEEAPPKSLFRSTVDGITFTEHIATADLKQGMALLQLAREAQLASEQRDAAQAATDEALKRLSVAAERYSRAWQEYMGALNEVAR